MTVKRMKIGPGVLKINAARTAAVTTTSGSAVITAASSTFLPGDVGAAVTGTGITGGTTILSYQSPTQVTLSVNATASGSPTVTITPTGGEQDFSCQIDKTEVKWSKAADADVNVLCGEVAPGSITWSATLGGDMLIDGDTLTQYTWDNKGKQVSAVFIPNSTGIKKIVGTVTVEPLDITGDVGKDATATFSWDFVGVPLMVPNP